MKRKEREKVTEVISYSGYRGEEHPLYIVIEGERIPVIDWIFVGVFDVEGKRKRVFRVKTNAGLFECHYFEDEKKWAILKID